MKRIPLIIFLMCAVMAAGPARAATISGKIVDSGKNLLQYFMETGARWNGKFDSITSPMVDIIAYNGDTSVGRAHPEEDGSFAINTTQPADKIVLSVPDGGYYLVKKGNWPGDARVDLNVNAIPSLKITGVAKDNGKPVSFEGVSAVGGDGQILTRVSTRSDGRFELHSSVPVASLKTYFASLDGPWNRDSRVQIGK